MLEIQKFQSKYEVIVRGRKALTDYLRDCKNNSENVLLCLSGGSALDLLKDFDYSALGSNVTVTALDERFSSDPGINNMAQIEKTGFMDKAKELGCQIINTKVEPGETMEEFVAGFNMALVRWQENHKGGKIVVTAGMGPDGHTSGIIPGSENFKDLFKENSGRLVVGYTAVNQPEDRNQRVTTNFDFLRSVAYTILVVMGDEKILAKQRLEAKDGTLEQTPARIWRESRGNVLMFTNL